MMEKIIIIIAAIFVAILIFGLVIFLIKRPKKKPKLSIDQDFVNQLINKLGGKDNIKEIDVIENKLKVEVVKRDILDLNGLKEMAASGVFLTGNVIKTLFKYDSKILKEEIKKFKEEK